ncbi:hypothetical protein FRB90_012561 [Tulasnella sp. 427]|nr:hypothetical protein FRB90_012561 [Tulasnella sp. 427]
MSSVVEKLNKLKIADLKPILAKVGLPVSGKKNELVDRILASKEALAAAGLSEDAAPAAGDDMNADLPDLPPSEEADAPSIVPTAASATVPPAVEPPATATTTTASATTTEAPKLDDEAERRRKRAERFGIPLVEEKKAQAPAKSTPKATASKAGGAKAAPTNANPAATEDPEKMRKRAERFGVPLAAPGASNGRAKNTKEAAPAAPVDPAEDERKRKRAERFGIAAGSPAEKKAKAES